ncbi:DUF4199 domain-containing protein [Prevotella histicola]
MIYEEYKQLSAYARYDGFYLSILWVASFACTLGASLLPILGHFSTLLLFSSPFFVAYRLRLFRDEGRNGIISYGRGLFYCLRVFFNASVLFSLLQWLYMNYLDNGRIYRMMTTLFSSQEGRQALTEFWTVLRSVSVHSARYSSAHFLCIRELYLFNHHRCLLQFDYCSRDDQDR